MQKYDLTVLVQKAEISDKIEKIVTAAGGKVGRMVEMGKKQLAYPIKKLSEATFLSWTVELPAEVVQQLNRKLTIDKEVVRHLLIKMESK
jgi:small subunit ribosomal protein S6